MLVWGPFFPPQRGASAFQHPFDNRYHLHIVHGPPAMCEASRDSARSLPCQGMTDFMWRAKSAVRRFKASIARPRARSGMGKHPELRILPQRRTTKPGAAFSPNHRTTRGTSNHGATAFRIRALRCRHGLPLRRLFRMPSPAKTTRRPHKLRLCVAQPLSQPNLKALSTVTSCCPLAKSNNKRSGRRRKKRTCKPSIYRGNVSRQTREFFATRSCITRTCFFPGKQNRGRPPSMRPR